MKKDTKKWLCVVALESAGIGVLIWTDWRIALGVFLVVWAGNLKHMIEAGHAMEIILKHMIEAGHAMEIIDDIAAKK